MVNVSSISKLLTIVPILSGSCHGYVVAPAGVARGPPAHHAHDPKPAPPETTFYFGSLSGDTQSGNTGAGPSQSDVCHYVKYKDGHDICKAENVIPEDDSGGCPGQKLTSPNFCGQAVGLGYPASYKLRDGDDCGATENKQYKTDPKKAVPKGTHYADIVDADNGNKKVGECVYDLSKNGYCTDVITTLVTEHFITCKVH